MGSMNVRAGFLLKGTGPSLNHHHVLLDSAHALKICSSHSGLWDRQPSPFVGLSYNIGGQNNVAQLTNGNGVDFRTRVPLAKKFEVEVRFIVFPCTSLTVAREK